MAGTVSQRQAFHHSAARLSEASGAGVAHRKESQQPEQTLLVLNARWERDSPASLKSSRWPPDSARRTWLTHPACPSAEPAAPRAPAPRPCGREFADLALGRTLPELGRARRANERASRRARLPPHALIGPAACETGLAGGGRRRRRVPGASGSGARAPRRPAPLLAVFSLPPSSSLPGSLPALPGSGRALAGLRIAHSGGAAVFVGWGSGLPLAAGIRTQPG